MTILEVLPGHVVDLHVQDHPRIAAIAPGHAVVLGQGIIEGPSRVGFNALHVPAKLCKRIGIVYIGDRDGDPWVSLNVPILLPGGRMREREMLAIL
jgi:hypothetical protein